jgi:hypothetical protein
MAGPIEVDRGCYPGDPARNSRAIERSDTLNEPAQRGAHDWARRVLVGFCVNAAYDPHAAQIIP